MADERYRVVSGDNLYRIGRKFGINYKEIMAANRLSRTTIYPNQILLIPNRKPQVSAKIVQSAPKIRTSSSRTRISQPQPVKEYAGAPPIRTRTNPYRNSTVPRDPVEPFAIAKKLPPAPPLVTEEDPLGLGYDPTPKARPVEPRVIAHRVPTQPTVPQINQPRSSSRGFARSREVPAAAYYPGRTGNKELDPGHFPMPSFKNPCTPKKSSRSSSSPGSRSYTVQSGDSVWSISRKFGVAPLKLRTSNGILFSKVRPGMCLKIPASHGIWSH